MLPLYIFTILLLCVQSRTSHAQDTFPFPPDPDTCQQAYLTMENSFGFWTKFANEELGVNTDAIFDRIEFLIDNYGDFEESSTRWGFQDISIDFPVDDPDVPQSNKLFGYTTTTTNFSVSMQTYFTAPESGEYTFEVTDVSEYGGAMLQVIAVDWAWCCEMLDQDLEPDIDDDDDIENYLPPPIYYIPSDPAHNSVNSLTFTLREGFTYQLLELYINTKGSASYKFQVTFPNGQTITDFSGYVGNLMAFDCDNYHTKTTVYSEWEDLFTTTTGTSIVTHDMVTTTTIETIYYVVTPVPVEPSSSEEPIITEPSSSEEPIITEPSSSEEPIITEPSSSEEPIITEPSSSEEPIITEPSSSEEPIITEPSSSEEPIITDVSSSEEPIITDVTSSDEPIITEPSSSEDPGITEYPSSSEPIITDVTSSEEPIVTDVTSSDEPIITDVTSSDEPIVTDITSSEEPVVTDVTSSDEPIVTDVTSSEEPIITDVTSSDEPIVTDITSSEEPITTGITSRDETSTTDEIKDPEPTLTTSTITVTEPGGNVYTTVTVCTVTDAHTDTHTVTVDCTSEACVHTTEGVIPPVTTKTNPVTTKTDTVTNALPTDITGTYKGTTTTYSGGFGIPHFSGTASANPGEEAQNTVGQATKPANNAEYTTNPTVVAQNSAEGTVAAAGTAGTAGSTTRVTTQLAPTASLYHPDDVNAAVRANVGPLLSAAGLLLLPLLL
ncbi:hypothetical protein DAKH74_018380 [Maudiozyma humilis]|uniref:PA14 domain-containing protein n=1 Tax=Maudiozyma humilis TaxID=51915 RepID=A0AAV5RWW8_MAUHU|nr:hypothetical protein DAKH74_018380 [Kazachstania humilis]